MDREALRTRSKKSPRVGVRDASERVRTCGSCATNCVTSNLLVAVELGFVTGVHRDCI